MNFIGLLRTLERITRPLSHDVDLPVVERCQVWETPCNVPTCPCRDGAEQLAEREAETECLVPEDFNAVCRCAACVAEERAAEDELAADDDEVSEPWEPELNSSERVAVRQLIEDRFSLQAVETGHDMGLSAASELFPQHTKTVEPPRRCHARKPNQAPNMVTICDEWAGHDGQHRHGQSEFWPHKSSASNHGAESAPSPTIVQSAPPPTVDGEGSPADSGIPQSPAGEHPTSELLTRAADVIDISAAFASALGYCNEDTGTQLDVFSAELRDRAATFEAIEE